VLIFTPYKLEEAGWVDTVKLANGKA